MTIKTSRSPTQHLTQIFPQLRRNITQILTQSPLTYINSISSSHRSNPKRSASFFKTKTQVSIKLNNSETTSTKNNVQIPNLFNTYFASIITHQKQEQSKSDIIFEKITLTNDERFAALRNLQTNKPHGPDAVPAPLLTQTASNCVPHHSFTLCTLQQIITLQHPSSSLQIS